MPRTDVSAVSGGAPGATVEVWARLQDVRQLSFVARSARGTAGWNGAGAGVVAVETQGPGTIVFTESGLWQPHGGREIRFRNVFRWSLDEAAGRLRLEHLRFGPDKPVFLFALACVDGRNWRSTKPHVCADDRYSAVMALRSRDIRVRWTVVGPAKAEEFRYCYL